MTRRVERHYFAECEPTLADLIADPILRLLMARDRVEPCDIAALSLEKFRIGASQPTRPRVG